MDVIKADAASGGPSPLNTPVTYDRVNGVELKDEQCAVVSDSRRQQLNGLAPPETYTLLGNDIAEYADRRD